MTLILASSSSSRQNLLTRARIPFKEYRANIDEDLILQSLMSDGAPARDCVDTLAEYKARKVSQKFPDQYVLGCDQLAECDGAIFGKPKSENILSDRLKLMRNKPHRLWTGNVIYKEGKPVWRYVSKSELTLADINDQDIAAYITEYWDDVKSSCAGYYFEETPHLFQSAKGDYADILGISLSQITAYLKLNGELPVNHPDFKMAAVLGHPIKQSKSPSIHKRWMDLNSIAGDYIAIDVPEGQFDRVISNLASVNFQGVNVTVPHKLSALAVSDDKSESAKLIGASNTLVFEKTGSVLAQNTDAYGFITNLQQGAPNWDSKDSTALVLGAGGAARAVLFALVQAGVSEIILTNRNREKADELASNFPNVVRVMDWEKRYLPVGAVDLIVNTTSLGMMGCPELEIDLSELRPETVVTDLVYKPLMTDLLSKAHAKGCTVVDGLGMLLFQAAPAFEAWFGVLPTVDQELRELVLS